MQRWSERVARRQQLNGEILRSRMQVFPGFQDLGRRVFTDGAISRKHKELMALAVAVSQNCFE